MLKIKVPFGFKTLNLDNMFVIHTGKIRLKCEYAVVFNALQTTGLVITDNGKGYTTIRYMTVNFSEHCTHMENINNFIADMMHARIDHKYRNRSSMLVSNSSILEDELPF